MADKELLTEAFLEDERLTDGLTDKEADILIKWGLGRIERINEENSEAELELLKKYTRKISKAYQQFNDEGEYNKAERFLGNFFSGEKLEEAMTELKNNSGIERLNLLIKYTDE